jgi:glycosyltransferase involved in cell wall biosynthesis
MTDRRYVANQVFSVSDALLIRLSGDAEAAAGLLRDVFGAKEVTAVSLADVVTSRALQRRVSRLALVGEPPSDEIGFGLLPLAALLSRAQRVVTIDARTGTATEHSRGGFVARKLGASLMQLTASAGAIGLQRLLVETLRLAGMPAVRATSGDLRSVLYLHPHAGVPGGVGGSVTHTHEVIRALRSAGIDVEGLTSDPAIALTAATEPEPPCEWRTLKVVRPLKAIPASAMIGVDMAMILSAYKTARRVDAIYQRHARFSLVGALLSRLTGKPLFLEYNGSEVYAASVWGQRTPLMRQLQLCERAALASAAVIVVVAEASKAELIGMGVDPHRILVNPNGVDAERFAGGGRDEVRRELGLDGTEVIGFVGSFGPWHGAPVLARAFAEIAAQRPQARLLLVGEGPQRDEVVRILHDGSVANRAVLTGKVPPRRVPAYLDACDVLVSPHVDLGGGVEFFGSPTKLFEYMASGKPIVASRLGQIADVLADGESAMLVAPGDTHELARALERLLDDHVAAAALGAAARRAAIERHSWRDNAVRVIHRFRRLADAGDAS